MEYQSITLNINKSLSSLPLYRTEARARWGKQKLDARIWQSSRCLSSGPQGLRQHTTVGQVSHCCGALWSYGRFKVASEHELW